MLRNACIITRKIGHDLSMKLQKPRRMLERSCFSLTLLWIFSALCIQIALSSTESGLGSGANLRRDRSLLSNNACTDDDWCHIKAPAQSLFRFSTPIDPVKWEIARSKAASGELVLLYKIMKHFPNYLDFLDGDTKFRKLHHIPDFFVDRNRDLSPLISDSMVKWKPKPRDEPYKWAGKKVIPRNHDYYAANRAPIFQLGYHAFSLSHALWYGGHELGKAVVSRKIFAEHWQAVRDNVTRPYIMLDAHDEHWGFVSTHFPNRTAKLGDCCGPTELAAVMDFLHHNKTLLAVVNQHTNLTHPKLLSLPRGLPLHYDHGARLIWDTMHSALHTNLKKNAFVATASSEGGFRPQIMSCMAKKFKASDFVTVVRSSAHSTAVESNENNANTESKGKKENKAESLSSRREYYTKLASSRVGIALPGVGYDTYRLWELLTMGAVAVIEKGVGLDKTVWRLPVLLVDDFAEVTPILLRTAYIEAVYRAQENEFEFQRLTQSFWYSFLMRVSHTQSLDTVLQAFPVQAENSMFTRPVESFDCGKDGRKCGPGTKRSPRESC